MDRTERLGSGLQRRPPMTLLPAHGVRWLPLRTDLGGRVTAMAADYDEVRSDVKESQENSLEALQSAKAPDANSVVRELDEAGALDDAAIPGGAESSSPRSSLSRSCPRQRTNLPATPAFWSVTDPRSPAKGTGTSTASNVKAR